MLKTPLTAQELAVQSRALRSNHRALTDELLSIPTLRFELKKLLTRSERSPGKLLAVLDIDLMIERGTVTNAVLRKARRSLSRALSNRNHPTSRYLLPIYFKETVLIRWIEAIQKAAERPELLSSVTGLRPRQFDALLRRVLSLEAAYRCALNTIIERNLRFVVVIALRYPDCGIDLDERISYGNLGLIRAAKRFDPERGFRFSTHAEWWIRQAILKAIIENVRTVRIPIDAIGAMQATLHAQDRFFAIHGRKPTVQELATLTGKSTIAVEQALSCASQRSSSLNAADGSSNGRKPLHHRLRFEDTEAIDGRIDRARLRHALSSAFTHLTAMEQRVLTIRYGLGDGIPRTKAEAARIIDRFARQRLQQIEAKALRKLRACGQAIGLDAFLA